MVVSSFHELANELVNRSLSAAQPLDPPQFNSCNVVNSRGQRLEDISEGTGIFDEDEDL